MRFPCRSRRRRLGLWVALLCGWHLVRLGALGAAVAIGAPPADVTSVEIDLNRARVPELMALPGIGRHRAEAIVLHRVRHGRFRSLSGLLSVDGLGAATLRELRPFLRDPADPPCLRTGS